VFALYEDREGSLWVATKHGLNQFLDGITTSYTMSEGLPSNQAGPVLEDSRGTVWAGTLGGGLGRFDGHRFTTLTTANGLASNTIYALAEGRDGDLWAGTAAGLNRLRRGRVTDTWTTRRGLPVTSSGHCSAIGRRALDRHLGRSRRLSSRPDPGRPHSGPGHRRVDSRDRRRSQRSSLSGTR
jgi:hypothetical protein